MAPSLGSESIGDFGSPWPRGPLPADADPTELIVGWLDTERASGETWTAAEFNAHSALFAATHGLSTRVSLTDAQLARIRAVRQELFARWRALPPEEALALPFDRHTP